MSQAETQAFLEELVKKYDPDADVSAGSRAQSELIEPILQRIGIDPFDEDIGVFIRTRVAQAFPDRDVTEVDDFADLLINPAQVLMTPLVREIKLVQLRRSLRNISSLSDDEVDALMGNFFSARIAGGFSVGVVRAYFSSPQSISVTQTQAATTRSGLRFYPTRPQAITADQMRLNIDGSEYYFDINYTAENRGDEYNVERNEIVSIANLPTATRVRNLRRFDLGTARETSAEFAARTQASHGDKTLTVERGIIATVKESFPSVRQLFVIGYRDPEMQRDIIQGGGVGEVPADDTFGSFFGTATAIDDLDGDGTTAIFDGGASANFVSRLGSVGSRPAGWTVSFTYTYDDPDPGIPAVLRVLDVDILEVVSGTRLRVDHEVPLVGVTGFTWALRERRLTISSIPGGITLPDTADGELRVPPDTVHIGGKTDVYVAGGVEQATAAITSLADENPIAKGFNAQTQGSVAGQEDIVLLNDIADISLVEQGMSLILEEGADADSYQIIEVLTGPSRVRLSVDMTGTQANLSFRVTDELDVNLTDPRSPKVEGADLITSAGSGTVTTSSATNFIDANVQRGDTLEVIDEFGGGEFQIESVSALTLTVTPELPRTIPGAPYYIFRRSQAVQTPVMRVSALELLDSSSAPTGTTIPYRDPVLAVSRGFQNEGAGYPFDNIVIAGLVAGGSSDAGVDPSVGFVGLGGLTVNLETYNPDEIWMGPEASPPTITFSAGPNILASTAVSEINANTSFQNKGIRAVLLTFRSRQYVGLVSERHVRVTGGTGVSAFFGGFPLGKSNSDLRSMDPTDTLNISKIERSDLVEFLTGNNAGLTARVIEVPRSDVLGDGAVVLGSGPVGPEGTSRLYNNVSLRPDVGARARAGRPSVGSVRAYFLGPTSAEFDFAVTRAIVDANGTELKYLPDPENTRTLLPAYPRTDLLTEGQTSGTTVFQDTTQDFLLQRVRPGDVLEVRYQPIAGANVLASPGDVAVSGLVLSLRLDSSPYASITFPFNMPRQDVVDYINEQFGEDLAELSGTGTLLLRSSKRIEIDSVASSAAMTLFGITVFDSDHQEKGEYVIVTVSATTLGVSTATPFSGGPAVSDTYYRIKRYVQRISSTEMNQNLDVTGLYYADVEMVSAGPGDLYNLATGTEMRIEGHRADGYRLSTDEDTLSFSRAEVLRAKISPSILLVGSSDSPTEYVQLSQQNVQVSYERSSLADDIQSFVDSDYQRVVCSETLVRHLLPHYVSLSWVYAGGASEAAMTKKITDFLDIIEPDEEFEVSDLTTLMRQSGGATSVYALDTASPSGRSAPLFVIVYHDLDRSVKALVVRDFVKTTRMQRFLPGSIVLRRVSPGGIS